MDKFENEAQYLNPNKGFEFMFSNEHYNKIYLEEEKIVKENKNEFIDENNFCVLTTGFETNNFAETGDDIYELFKKNKLNTNNDNDNDINNYYNNDNNNENNYIKDNNNKKDIDTINNDNKIFNFDNNLFKNTKKKNRKNC